MLDNKITKPGTLLFHDGKVYVEGWELAAPGMCREHVIFACLYVAAELMKSAHDGIEGKVDRNTCVDLPKDVAEALGLWSPTLESDDVCEATGYSYSGTFQNSLSELRTAGVLVGRNTEVMRAHEDLSG